VHSVVDVCFWHKADMLNALTNVRFWEQTGHLTNRCRKNSHWRYVPRRATEAREAMGPRNRARNSGWGGEATMAKGLKELLKAPPEEDELRVLWAELAKDSTRGSVVLGAALIDDILRDVIKHQMVKLTNKEGKELFGWNGPLESFSSRIRMAYALGIIGRRTRHDLDAIREIRNAMAHGKRAIDFDTPELHSALKGLHCLRDISDRDSLPPKRLFVSACRIMMIHLLSKIRPLPDEIEGYPRVDISSLD
jgi:DNA-binding MltR family transcriptional regulator